MIDQSAAAVNFSYVLHEPSTSPAVTAQVCEMRKARARCDHAERRFQRMADHELRQRLVVDQVALDALNDGVQPSNIVSVTVGMWRLLDRCLAVAGLTSDHSHPRITYFDGSCESMVLHPFFRAPAQLCDLRDGTQREGGWSFAAAILRPGDESILIRFIRVDVERDNEELRNSLLYRLVSLAEKSIREFALQWECARQLWDEPAEAVLSEFKS